jgi:N-acetylmuramoyl-L-alanine amidase CwlA
MFTIIKEHIEGLPQQPYRNGIGAYEGVVAHATASYAPDENEVAYLKRSWQQRKAFVQYFVDWDSIRETADPKYKAWGAGNANPRYVHVELCQTKDPKKFLESYKRYVWLLAHLLYVKRLGVTDGKTLVSHDWVSKNLGGTNHSDPIGYLKEHGVNWTTLVSDVKNAYSIMEKPKTVDPVAAAIKKLEAAGIMKSPQYWQENAKTGKTCRGDYVGQLLINLASSIK